MRLQNGTRPRRRFGTRLEAVLACDQLHRQDQRLDKANFDTSGNRQRFWSSQTGVTWWAAGREDVTEQYTLAKAATRGAVMALGLQEPHMPPSLSWLVRQPPHNLLTTSSQPPHNLLTMPYPPPLFATGEKLGRNGKCGCSTGMAAGCCPS